MPPLLLIATFAVTDHPSHWLISLRHQGSPLDDGYSRCTLTLAQRVGAAPRDIQVECRRGPMRPTGRYRGTERVVGDPRPTRRVHQEQHGLRCHSDALL